MKVAFVLDEDIAGQEPLGVSTLGAMLLARGHAVEYFPMGAPSEYSRTVERVNAFAPRLVGYSISSGLHKRYVAFNHLYKQADPKVFAIAGGPHASYFPEFLDQHAGEFDAICRGEGEYALAELAAALERGDDHTGIENLHVVLPGGSIRKNPLRPFADLDDLPSPDHSLIRRFPRLERDVIGYMMAGRGCPYNCAFCFNHVAIKMQPGRFIRQCSVDRVIEEARRLRDDLGKRYIAFQDDTMTQNKAWVLEFAPRYKREVGLPFLVNSRPDRFDEEVAGALAGAGWDRAVIGLETASDELRNEVMDKRVTTEQIRRASRLITGRGVKLVTQNLFGVPGETVATALATIALNIECKTSMMVIHFLQPYPGTRIAERCRALGLWDSDVDHLDETNHRRLGIALKNKRVIEDIGNLSWFFVDFPRVFRLFAPLFRVLERAGLAWLILPFTRALHWFDRRTALRPWRGPGARYHPPDYPSPSRGGPKSESSG